MKSLPLSTLALFALMMSTVPSSAQGTLTSSQFIEAILNEPAHRDELERLRGGITAALSDTRLNDQATRQMLQHSQAVLTEMLNQKDGSNFEKLIELAKWFQMQTLERHAINDAGIAPTPQQQFVLDNPLAGQEVYLP